MDISGLDRDFFIHKYEAAKVSGTVDGAFGNLPRTPNNPGSCFESVNSTNSITPANCGDGTSLSATNTIAMSAPSTAPFTTLRQGDAIFTCMRSELTDVDGIKYRLHLPSPAEWTKAADWGDVDMDGVIDQNGFTGSTTSIAVLQSTLPADAASIRCHVDASPASPYSSADANTANCVSRYGAENMVGNVAEWVLERTGGRVELDNGVDAIGYGRTLPSTNGTITSLTFDMLSALPIANGASLYSEYDAFTAPNSTDGRYGLRGGSFDSSYGNPGRFSSYVTAGEYDRGPKLGFRCSY
ncbi:MAG: hypothetical protein EOP09_10765 [Proteobacteria bacterium]|nr:MAG: hypothetical protein EOP09_10765 [Pseudomonadota bacterium]